MHFQTLRKTSGIDQPFAQLSKLAKAMDLFLNLRGCIVLIAKLDL